MTHPGLPFEHPRTLKWTAGVTQLDTQLFQGAEIFLRLSSACWLCRRGYVTAPLRSRAAGGLVNKVAVMQDKSSPNEYNEKPHSFQQIVYRKYFFFFFLTHRGMLFLFLFLFFETNKQRTKPETSPSSVVCCLLFLSRYIFFLWKLLTKYRLLIQNRF